MLVSEIMTPNPITVGPESDYLAAIALMRARRCRHLPVIDTDGQLVGIVSAEDLKAVRAPTVPREQAIRGDGVLVRIHEVMTTNVIIVPPDYPLEEAAQLMVQHHVAALPVVEDGRVAGIITDTDIFGVLVAMLGGGSQTIRLSIQVDNRPGEIAAVGERIAAVGGNILNIASYPADSPDRMNLTLRVELAPLQTLVDAVHTHPSATVRHIWDKPNET